MGILRDRMIEEMKLRNFSPATQESYVYAVSRLAKYHHQSPDQLTKEDIRAFLVHLTVQRKLSPNSLTGYCSGLRFFYNETLGWDETKLFIPPRKKPSLLPEVSRKKQAGLKTVGLSCSMATPFIPTGITPGDCPDQLAQERNDNAKTIKMDGAIRSGANSEFEILCSSHSIADVRSGFCRFEVGGNSAGVSILAGL